MNGKDIVSAVLLSLAQKIDQKSFALWFGESTRLTQCGDTLRVEAGNKFSQDWLRSHYRRPIEAACLEVAGKTILAEFHIDPTLSAPQKKTIGRRQRGNGHAPQGSALPQGQLFNGGNPSSNSLAGMATSPVNGLISPVSKLSVNTNGHSNALKLIGGKSDSIQSGISTANGTGGETATAGVPSNAVPMNSFQAERRRFSTLESFVVGATNRLAHASALSVVERLGSWSPLFIHGPHGCGKTHLLEGIWTTARRKQSGINVVYLSAEQFTTLFLSALRGGGLPSFRRKYRGVDLLLIDDLQFLTGKKATLVELLHTIDTSLREGRQLVFSADRPPSELTALGPQLTSRLASGMVCRIETPDLSTRIDLVHRFACAMNSKLPNDVAEFVAAEISAGGRELLGAVNQLHAASRMLGCQIDRSFAEETLAELLQTSGRVVRLADIERAVCDVFGLDKHSLQTDRRAKRVSTPRMLAMWLARKHTRAGLTEIGHYFGRRSHSTVISAQRRVADWLAEQSEIEMSHTRCKIDEAVRRVEAHLRTG